MLILGLTGGIGMGKSTAASILAGFGLPVHNADQVVHGLLQKGGKAVKPIAKIFPEVLKGGAIDRAALGRLVFHHPVRLKKLEKILHPLVVRDEKLFLKEARRAKVAAVVLEIPLLFETKADRRCDVVLCVTAPRPVQKARVLQRQGMTEAKFKAILARQMPDKDKQRRADFVIQTGTSRADTQKQLRKILDDLKI